MLTTYEPRMPEFKLEIRIAGSSGCTQYSVNLYFSSKMVLHVVPIPLCDGQYDNIPTAN